MDQPHQLARPQIGRDADDSFRPDRHERQGEGIIPAQDHEIVAERLLELIDPVDRTARLFDGAHMRILRPQPRDQGHADLHAAPAGDRVEDDRPVGGLGHLREMAEQAFLRGPVVVGRHHQHRVGPGVVRRPGEFQRLAGGIGARAGHDRRPAPGCLDHAADHVHVLPVRKRGRLAGGTHGHQPIDARFDLEFDQRTQFVVGHLLAAERGHERGESAGERAQLHI